jgi:hypothetical protein
MISTNAVSAADIANGCLLAHAQGLMFQKWLCTVAWMQGCLEMPQHYLVTGSVFYIE